MLKPGQIGGGVGVALSNIVLKSPFTDNSPQTFLFSIKKKNQQRINFAPTQTYSRITVIIVYIGISDSEVQ